MNVLRPSSPSYWSVGFAAATLLLGLQACGAASSSAPLAVDSAKDDIQVLSANGSGTSISPSGAQGGAKVNLSDCQRLSQWGRTAVFDCTAELERLSGAPALETVRVFSETDAAGNPTSSQYFCRLLTVKTVLVRTAAEAATFTGIGFWSSQGGGIRFVPKAMLKQTGLVALKDGREAYVHEFAGTALCWQGSSSSSMRARYQFKPYAAYEEGGETFNVWENVSDNHSVSTTTPGWNRSADLLQH